MKIGIIRDTLFTNEPRGLNIAKQLEALGHQVEVLCYGKTNTIEQLPDAIRLHRFKASNFLKKKLFALVETFPLYKYFWARKIKAFAKKNKIEVLHIHDLYMAGAACIANKSLGLPMVLVFHENYVESIKTYRWATSRIGKFLTQPQLWHKLEPIYLKQFTRLIVTCDEFKQELIKKYSFLKEEIIYTHINTPDLNMYNLEEKVKQSQNFVLFYFGVVGYRRGVQTAIEAIEYLKESIPQIKLVYIGPTDADLKDYLNTLIKNKKLGEHIEYVPWIDISEFHEYVAQADVCISPLIKNPHHDSTIANKIFQYMLYQKPLLVSNSTPQENIVNKYRCGLVHRSEDARDFANKVLELKADPNLRQEMGANGRRAVLEEYNLEVQSKEFVKFYANFINQIK